MKVDLIDIGIKDLRDFTLYSDEFLFTNLKKMSSSSLKLRLQFLVFQNKFRNFDSFFIAFKKDEKFQQRIVSNIYPQADELFRDASCFDCFLSLLKQMQQKELIEMCVFEFGNYAETVSLIIFLTNYGYINKVQLTIIDLTSRKCMPSSFEYSFKDVETAEINYAALNDGNKIDTFFSRKEKYYEYLLPKETKIHFKKLSEVAERDTKYNIIVSRNLTLHYNFHAHQNIFLMYVNFLKKNGILFVGTNEGFDWCSGREQLMKTDAVKPLYIKN